MTSTPQLPDNFLNNIYHEVDSETDSESPYCLKQVQQTSIKHFPYKLYEKIDQGGMKEIYRAFDERSQRQVALAYIKSSNPNEKDLRYFIQEAWITAGLQHPNIVPIHDIGTNEEGKPYFAMKLLSGENLANILKHISEPEYREKYSLRNLLDVFSKVCDAVSYAHSQGVCHLDLKPENIQVSDFGEVLLIDWGIAFIKDKNRDHDEELFQSASDTRQNLIQTMFGAIKGTPGYIAPEVWLCDKNELSQQADIYGLGAILYSILSHDRPPPINPIKPSFQSPIRKVNLIQLFPEKHIPPALNAVVTHAMEQDPKLRYKSTVELKKDIVSFLNGYATTAEHANLARLLLLFIKRNTSLAISILIALIFSLSITFVFIQKLSHSRNIALKNEQKAIANEIEAEKSLQLFLLERDEKIKREKTSVKHYFDRAKNQFYNHNNHDAWNEIKTALALNPKDYRTNTLALAILLSQQRFQKIVNEFSILKNTEYYSIALEFSHKKNDTEQLAENDLEEFLSKVQKSSLVNYQLGHSNIFNTINAGKSFIENKKLIRDQFSKLNPDAELTYNEQTDHIVIKSKRAVNLSPLAGLNLKGLNLSQALVLQSLTIKSLKQLTYLNLMNNNLERLDFLENLTQLRYLNLKNSLTGNLKQRLTHKLDYLNVSNTTTPSLNLNKTPVVILNISFCIKLDTGSIFKTTQPPKLVIISSENDTKKFRDLCKEYNVKILLNTPATPLKEYQILKQARQENFIHNDF
ncbi:serine/threonine-protein kinase [Lentisphaera araneosa HTCC2155]|uniref:Serine/threonine-protein kinase n=1 Tax=Lentisphaera araneosa HTCC2155 TaxID=313628 RepID=A6DQB5_9BACT|nr:protein kinase [Lentisphaera araneosa]EDM26166.1 serine/threonine-protein kinase [Lentisphaera araneosa HTCC2155]